MVAYGASGDDFSEELARIGKLLGYGKEKGPLKRLEELELDFNGSRLSWWGGWARNIPRHCARRGITLRWTGSWTPPPSESFLLGADLCAC